MNQKSLSISSARFVKTTCFWVLALLVSTTSYAALQRPLRRLQTEELLAGIHNRTNFDGCEISLWTLYAGLLAETNNLDTSVSIRNSLIAILDEGPAHLTTNRTVRVGLDIIDSTFQMTTFENVVFLKPVYFSGSTFSNAAFFKKTQFLGGCGFSGAHFYGGATFEGAKFGNSASFARSRFDGTVDFSHAEFKTSAFTPVEFTAASFGATAFFSAVEFPGPVYFHSCVFAGPVAFDRTQFKYTVYFNLCQFQDDALFEDSFCGALADFPAAKFHGRLLADKAEWRNAKFESAEAEREASFRKLKWSGVLGFSSMQFHGDVSFRDARGSNQTNALLDLSQVRFSGRAYFDNAQLDILKVSGDVSPTTFEHEAYFQRAKIKAASFDNVEFQKDVYFDASEVSKGLCFTNVYFLAALHLNHVLFPSKTDGDDAGFHMEGVLLNGPLILNWQQLKQAANQSRGLKLQTRDPDVWQILEDGFKRAGNLEGQNQAMFERMLSERIGKAPWNDKVLNYFSWAFWGYGVRPLRVFLWIVFLFVLSSFVYWTQTRSLPADTLEGHFSARVWFALNFAWQTSLSFAFGPSQSRTIPFKAFTLFHSISIKVLVFFFLTAVANVSPLLNALVTKTFGF